MEFKVPEEVLQETTRCQHDFSCLKTQQCGNRSMCVVDKISAESILFLNSTEIVICPYRISFGQGQVCMCPVHYYLQKNKKNE